MRGRGVTGEEGVVFFAKEGLHTGEEGGRERKRHREVILAQGCAGGKGNAMARRSNENV